jgi:hypothetical protein
VPCVVLKEFKLVEINNLITTFSAKLFGLVEHLLHVRLATLGSMNLSVVSPQPLKPFLRHILWKNRNVLATKKASIEGSTTTEVTS